MTEFPNDVKDKLRLIHKKFFKDMKYEDILERFNVIYNEVKEEYKKDNVTDDFVYRNAYTKLKNEEKRKDLGGATDKFIGIILGSGRTNDLKQKSRLKIIKQYEEDPEKAKDEGLIVTRKEVDPTDGKVTTVPVVDDEGNIIPRDNREYFKRKDGSQFKNPNFDHPLGKSLVKNLIGIGKNAAGTFGICKIQLKDQFTELDVPLNKLVEFTVKVNSAENMQFKLGEYISNEVFEDGIMKIYYESELKNEGITKEIYDKNINEISKLKGMNKDITIFNTVSSRTTAFKIIESIEIIKNSGFPILKDNTININKLYKDYMIAYCCDCSNVLKYHELTRYIDDDPEKINYGAIATMQNVNVIQLNLESSISGNLTMYIDDDSLMYNELNHLDKQIDSIRVLIPDHIKIDFAEDSKVNIIGSFLQFQAQDEEKNPLFTEEANIVNGKELKKKVPVLAFPILYASGIYALPEYKKESEVSNLEYSEKVNIDKLSASIEDDIKDISNKRIYKEEEHIKINSNAKETKSKESKVDQKQVKKQETKKIEDKQKTIKQDKKSMTNSKKESDNKEKIKDDKEDIPETEDLEDNSVW